MTKPSELGLPIPARVNGGEPEDERKNFYPAQPATSWSICEIFGKSFGMRGPDTNRSIWGDKRKRPATEEAVAAEAYNFRAACAYLLLS